MLMYLIAASAFMFYITKIPERYFPGECSSRLFHYLAYPKMTVTLSCSQHFENLVTGCRDGGFENKSLFFEITCESTLETIFDGYTEIMIELRLKKHRLTMTSVSCGSVLI